MKKILCLILLITPSLGMYKKNPDSPLQQCLLEKRKSLDEITPKNADKNNKLSVGFETICMKNLENTTIDPSSLDKNLSQMRAWYEHHSGGTKKAWSDSPYKDWKIQYLKTLGFLSQKKITQDECETLLNEGNDTAANFNPGISNNDEQKQWIKKAGYCIAGYWQNALQYGMFKSPDKKNAIKVAKILSAMIDWGKNYNDLKSFEELNVQGLIDPLLFFQIGRTISKEKSSFIKENHNLNNLISALFK